jgi:hypothetical protein
MKKADMPITPLIILVIAILFAVLAYFFIRGSLPVGLDRSLEIFSQIL